MKQQADVYDSEAMTANAFMIEDDLEIPRHRTEPKAAKQPRAKKGIRVSESLKNTVVEYKRAYKALYGLVPHMTYDGTWVRILGSTQGISPKRLKEMTTQLRNRHG